MASLPASWGCFQLPEASGGAALSVLGVCSGLGCRDLGVGARHKALACLQSTLSSTLASCAFCPGLHLHLLTLIRWPGEALALLVMGSRALLPLPLGHSAEFPSLQEASPGEGGTARVSQSSQGLCRQSWASREGPCYPGILPVITVPSLEKDVSRPLAWGLTSHGFVLSFPQFGADLSALDCLNYLWFRVRALF